MGTFKLGTLPVSDWARTSDGYFETLRMKLLKGRTFTRHEALSHDPDVAVINQAFARTYFANEEPFGKVFVFGNDRGGKTNYRIIGIVGNEHQMGPDSEQHAEFYLPSNQLRSMILVARTVRDPLGMASAVKQQVWNIDKEQPVSEVGTEEAALREWAAPRRFKYDHPPELCGNRTSARDARALQRSRLFRDAADAGDWNPHGARCSTRSCDSSHRATGSRYDAHRHCDRSLRCVRAYSFHAEPDLSCESNRCADFCRRLPAADCGFNCCQLHTGIAGGAN